MAPSSLTLSWDAQLSSTLFNYRKAIEDAISTANAFFFFLMRRSRGNGYKIVSDLGDRMAMPLMYELGNADVYSGLTVAPLAALCAA